MIPFRIVVGSSLVGCGTLVRLTARRTEPLALKDFVTDKNTLSGGSIESYARCIGTCLAEGDTTGEDKENNNGKRKAKTQDVDGNNKTKSHGRLLSVPREDGSRTLTLCLDVGCHAYHAKAEYCFTLLPIQREFVDVIAAKMVDVEEDVVEMKRD